MGSVVHGISIVVDSATAVVTCLAMLVVGAMLAVGVIGISRLLKVSCGVHRKASKKIL